MKWQNVVAASLAGAIVALVVATGHRTDGVGELLALVSKLFGL